MSYNSDTIAAIATASGSGSISIIRVSGVDSIAVVDKVFYKNISKNDANISDNNSDVSGQSVVSGRTDYLSSVSTHTVHHGWIGDSIDKIIDEALVLVMRTPGSYTAEDVVEIQCHGGGLAAKKILELLLDHGVRLAEPGEFTKRAFLNGRIDLTQAESVMEVISSKSELALSTAEEHLRGDVRDVIRSMREVILTDMAYLEAALDDPEHIEMVDYSERLLSHLDPIEDKLSMILKSSENGRFISEGINTVIVGRPNVGKSSFLNCILRQDRAIVTDVPGTTRDTLEEDVRLGGLLLRLVDTAGIRETSDEVESIGVEKAKSAVEHADLLICVLDSSEELTSEDRDILNMCKDKSSIVLLNKSDLGSVIDVESIRREISSFFGSGDGDRKSDGDYQRSGDGERKSEADYQRSGDGERKSEVDDYMSVMEFSARTGEGLRELEAFIEDKLLSEFLSESDRQSVPVITNLRQKEALFEVKSSIDRLRETIAADMPEDLLTVDLLSAYESLGRITGDTFEDDLVDKIFSDFCMGK